MRLRGAAILGAVLLSTAPALAQPSKEARAEALFKEGTKLLEDGKYGPACEKLAESRTLAVGVGVTLYLADCYESSGKPALAIETFRAAEQLARTRRDKRADVAQARAAELEAKTPSVTFEVTEIAGLTLSVDDVDLPKSAWSAPRWVDPGRHVVRASAPGHAPLEKSLDFTTARVVIVVDLRAETLPPSTAKTNHDAPTEAPAPRSTQKTIGAALAIVGLVGVGVGGVTGGLAISKQSESNEGHCEGNRCDAEGLALRDDGLTMASISTVGFIAGAALLAGGVVLYLTAPSPKTTAIGPRGLAVRF